MNLGKFEEASHRLYGMKMCFSHYHVNSRKTKFSLYGKMTSKVSLLLVNRQICHFNVKIKRYPSAPDRDFILISEHNGTALNI